MEKDNLQLIEQYFKLFNAHKWEEMADMYIEGAEFKDPSLGTGIVIQSKSEVAEKYSGMATMFPDLQDEIIQVYPSGEKHVIVEFISKGTAEDGFAFELPICTIFTIEDGKIVKDFTYYNNFDDEEEAE